MAPPLQPFPSGFPVTPRFEYVATLGRGGMGCVYEAFDRERGVAVALKTLLEVSPQRVLHLKREFRTLRDVRHPHLIALDDLVEVDGTWFFTMELLRGVDLFTYVRGRRADPPPAEETGSTSAMTATRWGAFDGVEPDPFVRPPPPDERPAPRFDEPRLRRVLGHLALGLDALHAAGLVHRDVKPANVLVAGDRAVLLDFGIAGRLEDEPHDGSVAGTWPYAAPEQLRGEPPSAAEDAYALGMCLFEALVGHLPVRGRPRPALLATRPPPRPDEHVRDLPADLAGLCARLLDPDPARRPSMREVLGDLDVAAPTSPPSLALAGEPAFVGRGAELDALDRAFEAARYGDAVCALVSGESGAGKTRLVQEFLARTRAAHPAVIVLEARCHARELVPYAAVDGIVDGLARHLAAPGAATPDPLPVDLAALVRAFPVLGGVPAIERARLAASGADDAASRLAGFAALRELLARFADEHVVILSIDDLQWADPDSEKLLAEVFAPGRAPPLLLVATMQTRDGAPPPAVVRALGDRVEHVVVRALDDGAAADLARVIGASLDGGRAVDAAAIARGAGGHPLFIAELVRDALERGGGAAASLAPRELERALVARVDALPAPARRLLELVTVAAAPIAHEIAAAAAALAPADYATPMTALARAHLVRVAGVRRADPIEPYHARIQAAVLSTLDGARRRALHGALARALEDGGGTPELLATHHELAGNREPAARHAARAAELAAAALAFERAAAWYRKALELSGPDLDARRRLAVALADVLVDAGQPLDAAETYRGAAAIGRPSPAEAFELRRRSAEQYLVGGYLPQGVAAMRALLDELGLAAPGTRTAGVLRAGIDRARLIGRGVHFTPRDAATIPPEDLAAIDICWSGASGVGQVDGLAGAIFALRGTLLSLACGEPLRVGRALSAFAISEASLGHRARSARALEGSRRAARIAATPLARFYPRLAELVCAYQADQDWQRCLDGCRAAAATWREAGRGRGWESSYVDIYTLLSLYRLGEVAAARAHVERLLAAARASRNRFLEIGLRLLSPFRLLVDDRPDEALADLEDAFASWAASLGRISHQHYWRLAARMSISLYRGLGAAERDALDREWQEMYRAPLGRVGMYRIEMQRTHALFAIGRAAEARAGGDRAGARRWRAQSAAWIARLEKARSPLAAEYAIEATAALASVDGDRARTIAALRTLVPQLDLHRHHLAGKVARWRLGQLLGGAEGDALAGEAAAWAGAQGVRDLDRLARTVLPGVAPPPR